MKFIALLFGLAVVTVTIAPVLAQDSAGLVGSWKLKSFRIELVDTKETKDALGPRPYGRMILTKGGHITNFRVAEGRTPPKTDADRAALLQSMAAWTGRYRATDKEVSIDIDASWTEFLTNTSTTRTYMLSGNTLTFTNTISSSLFFPGRAAVGVETFEREE
jgi:hypothetical protein